MRSSPVSDPFEAYRASCRVLLERLGPPEPLESLASRLGIGRTRHFFFDAPQQEMSPERGTALRVLDDSRTALFVLRPEPQADAELTSRLEAQFGFGTTAPNPPASFHCHAWGRWVATPANPRLALISFLHLDEGSPPSYRPSQFDCIFLLDTDGRVVLYNPSRSIQGRSGKFAMDDLFLPDGTLLERRSPDSTFTVAQFTDPAGRTTAQFRLLTQGEEAGRVISLEVTEGVSPLPPLLHGIFHSLESVALYRYRAQFAASTRSK